MMDNIPDVLTWEDGETAAPGGVLGWFRPEDPPPALARTQHPHLRVRNSQLMQMILIMVRVKKGSGAMSTLTKIAVIRKTTRMTTRLPEILNF